MDWENGTRVACKNGAIERVVSRDSDVINEILRLYANATFS